MEWLAPYRSAKRDPHPRWSTLLSRVRYRIDTVFGQFLSRDTYPGTSANPTSLNRFTYGNGDPALVTDPTGHLGLRDARNWVSNHANYSDVDVQVCGACIGNTVGFVNSHPQIKSAAQWARDNVEPDSDIQDPKDLADRGVLSGTVD